MATLTFSWRSEKWISISKAKYEVHIYKAVEVVKYGQANHIVVRVPRYHR